MGDPIYFVRGLWVWCIPTNEWGAPFINQAHPVRSATIREIVVAKVRWVKMRIAAARIREV